VTEARGTTSSRAVLGVVFLLVLGFSYSEEIVSGFFELVGQADNEEWRIALIVVDLTILAGVAALKRSIGRADGSPPRLWRAWWLGSAIVMGADLVLLGLTDSPPVWVDVLSSTLFAAALTVLMTTSLNADPLTLFSSSRRARMPVDWRRVRAIVPLMVGVFACYLAATIYVDYFDVDVIRALDPDTAAEVEQLPLTEQLAINAQLCSGAVAPAYFQQIVAIIPLLLLTLGVEFNYFRRTLEDPAQRAATAATVTLLSLALVFALSTLPWVGQGCDEILAAWHEYLAFIVTVQGVFTGLATLVWVLVARPPTGPTPRPDQQPRCTNAFTNPAPW